MRYIVSGVFNANPIRIVIESPTKEQAHAIATDLAIESITIRRDFSLFSKPSATALSRDFHLLSVMLESAISLQEAFDNLARIATDNTLRYTYAHIVCKMSRGENLQNAISSFGSIFSPLGVALIQAGAHTSTLSSMLAVLSQYFHTIANTKTNFLKALIYPLFVSVSIMIAFAVIAFVVIPSFAELFASFSVELPLSTRSLLFVSSMLEKFWWVGLMMCGLVVGFVLFSKDVGGARGMAYTMMILALMRVPLFGKLLVYRDLWGYFLGLMYLVRARIELELALEIALQSVRLKPLRDGITQAYTLLHSGIELDRAFSACAYIDPTLQSFLSTAHKSGELGGILEVSVQYCKSIYEAQITKALSLIEPLSTIIIALLVGWLAFGIFLPIWELGGVAL